MKSLRWQVMSVVLGTSLVPLTVVLVLSWQMLEAATLLGFHREVEQGLLLGAEQARDRHHAEKTAVRAGLEAARWRLQAEAAIDCAGLARDLRGLGFEADCVPAAGKAAAASSAADGPPRAGALAEGAGLVDRKPADPWLAQLAAGASTGPELVERGERGPVYGRLQAGGQALLLHARGALPASDAFDRMHRTALTYAHLSRVRGALSTRFLVVYLALAAGLTGLALLIGRGLAGRILRPVERLMQAVGSMGAGQLRVDLGPRPRGELGLLMEAVERMGRELEQSRDRGMFLEKIAHWQEAARRLAHEIQNPLTPIQLIVQELVAKHQAKDPRFAELLSSSVSIIEDEVASLRRLVETFSRFARLPEPRLAPVDLMALVRSFVEGRAGLNPGVEIRVSGPEAFEVQADGDLLRQVLRNLVDNSVEAMSGAGEIELRLEAAAGGPAQLVVQDTGPGVALALRERIFDPYVSSKSRGSGLGLAITRKVLFDHGWDIELAESGPGAVFRIRLGR